MGNKELGFEGYEERYDKMVFWLKEYIGAGTLEKPEHSKEGTMKQLESDCFFPIVQEKIEYVEKEPKSSPDELLRQKRYREWKKEDSKEKDEEKRRRQKIMRALDNRTEGFCYTCKKVIECKDKKWELKNERIMILYTCKDCNASCKSYGGKFN